MAAVADASNTQSRHWVPQAPSELEVRKVVTALREASSDERVRSSVHGSQAAQQQGRNGAFKAFFSMPCCLTCTPDVVLCADDCQSESVFVQVKGVVALIGDASSSMGFAVAQELHNAVKDFRCAALCVLCSLPLTLQGCFGPADLLLPACTRACCLPLHVRALPACTSSTSSTCVSKQDDLTVLGSTPF